MVIFHSYVSLPEGNQMPWQALDGVPKPGGIAGGGEDGGCNENPFVLPGPVRASQCPA